MQPGGLPRSPGPDRNRSLDKRIGGRQHGMAWLKKFKIQCLVRIFAELSSPSTVVWVTASLPADPAARARCQEPSTGGAQLVSFGFGEAQEELRTSVRRFLADKSPEAEVRRLMETADGYDVAVWRQMADQLGLQSLIIPERFGGSGYTIIELAVVLEEMGRALLCAPYFATVALAANLLLSIDDEAAQHEYLPGIADGSTVATVALTEASGQWDEQSVMLRASRSGSGWSLTGEKVYVLDGHLAGLVLVAARTDAGVSIFAVHQGAPGLTAVALTTMDQTRKQSRLTFDSVPARLIGTEGQGWMALSRMLDLAAVALAAEQVGGAQKVLDMSVEYAKVRVQFGRPIGSFQAIKHKCSNMLLGVETARSAMYFAAWAATQDRGELPGAAALAKSYCSEVFFAAAADTIQIHGGIGFTWEHPAHLYFKRAKSSEILLGSPAYHRSLVAERVGI
jgi:alkylation response protein AidB-like acyl-CoA dehydrogenase